MKRKNKLNKVSLSMIVIVWVLTTEAKAYFGGSPRSWEVFEEEACSMMTATSCPSSRYLISSQDADFTRRFPAGFG